MALVIGGVSHAATPDPVKATHPGADAAPASSPVTYPDAAGFQKRSDSVLRALATQDLGQWRRGYFSGGDPGKYLPAVAMARLIIDPNDPQPATYQNDDRSYREHYHFAAVNWARFIPLFGERVLTPDTRAKLKSDAARYGSYLAPAGTENHRTMWMTSANVLPTLLDTGLSNKSRPETLARAKEMLRAYVKGLYDAGQGEWDSSTYLMFDVNGMLNVYDFAEDAETRLLAKAALDWFVAGYALKYRDGIYCAPNQRGFAAGPHTSIADQTGYVWFGSNATPDAAQMSRFFYAVHAITSSYRPPAVLHRLATKQSLPNLPAQFDNTKPNYWYGQQIPPERNAYAETVYIARHYTMASLWNGFGGQITRWQLVADGPTGGVMITGGHPRRSDHTTKKLDEFGYADGLGRYDRTAQVGGTLFNVSLIPPDEPIDYAFVTLPDGVTPRRVGDWFVLRMGQTHVAVRAVAGELSVGQTELTAKQEADNRKASERKEPAKHVARPMLRITGKPAAFLIETSDVTQHADDAALDAALLRTQLKASEFATSLKLTYTNLAGRAIDFESPADAPMARVRIDGAAAMEPAKWDAVYNGPFIKHAGRVLEVNDGQSGFVVDFTGELPVYRPWKSQERP